MNILHHMVHSQLLVIMFCNALISFIGNKLIMIQKKNIKSYF